MKKILIFTVFVSILTLVGFWGGKKVCLMMSSGCIYPSQGWYQSLNLTGEQKVLLKKMEDLFREDSDKLCMQICRGRVDLLNQMKEEISNQTLAYQKVEEIGQLQTGLEKKIIDHIFQVKKHLTLAQNQTYLESLRKKMSCSMQDSGVVEALKQ